MATASPARAIMLVRLKTANVMEMILSDMEPACSDLQRPARLGSLTCAAASASALPRLLGPPSVSDRSSARFRIHPAPSLCPPFSPGYFQDGSERQRETDFQDLRAPASRCKCAGIFRHDPIAVRSGPTFAPPDRAQKENSRPTPARDQRRRKLPAI